MTSFLQNPASKDKIFLRNIMVTMLFAGRDNTSSSLAWSLYEMSRCPGWLQRMREEAIALGTEGQVPDYATINVRTPVILAPTSLVLTTRIGIRSPPGCLLRDGAAMARSAKKRPFRYPRRRSASDTRAGAPRSACGERVLRSVV